MPHLRGITQLVRLWEVVCQPTRQLLLCVRGATKKAMCWLPGGTGGLIFRMLPGNLAVGFPLLLMGLTQLNFMRATLKTSPSLPANSQS